MVAYNALMDLSFLRDGGLRVAGVRPSGGMRAPVWPILRAASAAVQSASPTALAVAGILRGQDESEDWVQELADIFAPRSSGMIEAVRLAGSFNPLIAKHFQVGKE